MSTATSVLAGTAVALVMLLLLIGVLALIARLFPVVYAKTVLQQAMYGFRVLDTGPAALWTVLGGWAVAAAGAWAYRLATAPRDT